MHKVAVSFFRAGYLYESLEARCRLDANTGTVVWDEIPEPVSWGRPLVTEAREAIAAGLADLETEQDRPGVPGDAPHDDGRQSWE
ncbi:MAG: hypothetical protein JWO67_3616 [Streptosporangiaceae bacterium]|nr:hypothetical protein [Streptosporangiaceae bacterium]